MVDEALVAILRRHGPLQTAVGERIYPDVAPPGTAKPYVTYFEVTDAPVRSLKGRSGLNRHLYQVDVHGASRRQAREVGGLVLAAVADFRRGEAGGQVVQDGFCGESRSTWAPPTAAEEEGHPVRAIEVVLWCNQ